MESFFRCSSLNIPHPEITNTSINFLHAQLIINKSAHVPEIAYINHKAINVTNVSFCAVSLASTNTNQTDWVNTQVWLPIDNWNGRMMGLGGGGMWCGLYPANMLAMLGAVSEGYAAVSTDCGHTMAQGLGDWLLNPRGEISFQLLEDFAGTSLYDAARMGKSVIGSFYGREPDHSYFSGCSQGGRQGMMLAQRYPDAYDGIVASAPAIDWAEILVSGFWTQFVMDQLDTYPQACELDYITEMAIRDCDDLDGVRDGMVSDTDGCEFNAFDLVGVDVPCGETTVQLSESAAIVATTAWHGPVFEGDEDLWTGVNFDSNLTSVYSSRCSPDGKCSGLPVLYSSDWIRMAVLKNRKADLHNMTYDDFVHIFNQSVAEYDSIIGTNEHNLTDFAERGGKILTFHGLADPMVPSRGTRRYYEAVADIDPEVGDYYRLFEAPGLGHCWTSSGLYPSTIFDDMVAWVEQEREPNSLPVSFTDGQGIRQDRVLCPYPERAVYDGNGDTASSSSYFCSADE
ncbi:Tannase/feruloyl esterase [Aspergillus karnatakaensis]|uniref:Tannase/feruloyl esterase n=1 Tax=Aspergillus karnatakaensis TaxID=1810916 RepID=UPI003CCD8F43